MHADETTYPPLNTLKRVVEDVWIVDGPLIRFGMFGLAMSFPTRMTVIRCRGGDLFIHSPTPLVPQLKGEIETAGTPRWIIGPNRIQYWWIPEWHSAFPSAAVYLAARIKEQAGGRVDFRYDLLESDKGYPWDAKIDTLPIAGRYMTEVAFFHKPSRTLILTDLIENFEPHKLGSRLARWMARLGGIVDPNGQMPRDMRLTFPRAELRAAVERMIVWNPARIIFAHGRWYDRNGTTELQRAFRWLLH
jgi:hypothetical protein